MKNASMWWESSSIYALAKGANFVDDEVESVGKMQK